MIFATWWAPFPHDNGARIRTHRLLTGLSAHFDVTLVTFADGPRYDETSATQEQLEAVLPGVAVRLVPFGAPHPGGLRRHVLKPHSVSLGTFATPPLRAALAELVQRTPEAVLHLDDPRVGPAGIGLPARLRALAPHNVEHRIVRELAKAERPVIRPFMALEWRKMAREERRLWRAADLCLAVSEIDAAAMRAGGARRVELCPNGWDPVDPLPPRGLSGDEPLRLLFVGSGTYLPYERGIAWFVREVLPRVRERFPAELDVVGSRPVRREQAEGVVYHGRVPSLREHYDRAHALVVPVLEGSGTRLKVLEACGYGRPVVSTTVGAEGLPLEAGRHFLLGDDAAAFANAIVALRERLAADPDGVAAMTVEARERTAAMTWPRIAEDLAQLYSNVLSVKP